MNVDIVAKLEKHLSIPVDTECAAVYLLVEVRKLLDSDKIDPKPFALWMYCHWAVHVDLHHRNTTIHFLEKIDSFVRNQVSGFESEDDRQYEDEQDVFLEFSSLDTFRRQLRQFLESHKLPTSLCDEDASWHRFISVYAGVIEGGTLSTGKLRETELQKLKAIQEVTFTKLPSSENNVFFVIQWDVRLKDGKTLTAVFKAMQEPSGVSHGWSYSLRRACTSRSLMTFPP